MLDKVVNYLVDKIYDGNILAFKIDPLVGTPLSILAVWSMDYHFAIIKVVGAAFLAIMSVSIGVLGPMTLRLLMHRYKAKYPIIGELLKHDKKEINED